MSPGRRLRGYLIGLTMAAAALGLRLLFAPLTGKGAPFVLFFGATLASSLVAGAGPALMVLLLTLPIGARLFAIPAGATPYQAVFQAVLYCVDGLIIIHLTRLAQIARRRLERTNRDLTDAVAGLRGSEARTREIVALSPEAYFQADLDGRIVDANQAGCALLGYTRDQLVSKTILDLIPVRDETRLAAVKAELLAPGAIHTGEWILGRQDGSTVLVEISSNILPDGRWQAFARNITERKWAEEALRRSELKFRRLVGSIPDGVFINQGGRIVYANRTFGLLLGYNDEQGVLGRMIDEIVAPESRELVESRIRFVQEAGKSAPPQEVTMVRRDGSPQKVESVGIGVEFEGAPAIVVVVRDLSERLRAEEALRFSEAKFSGIVSISADAIITVDQEQRITVFNTGAEKIFGYSREEVLGAPLDLLLPQRLREGHRGQVAEFGAGRSTARRMGERLASILGRRKNGEEFPAEASIANLKVGETTLLTVVLRDVTERERAERQQRVLAEVGVALAASLDYERTLAAVAQIAVRDCADWCIIDLVETSESVRRVKVACADASNQRLSERLERIPLDRRRPYLTRTVVELRQPVLIPRLAPEQVTATAQSPEHLEALRAVRPVSLMSAPLLLRDQLLGTLTFVSSTPTRIFSPEDLRFALALAERAALAIENARLYQAALRATRSRDQVLGVVAHDLRNPLSNIALHAAALQPSPLEPRNQRHREAIERATRRMSRLIQDLLDVTVLETGRLRVERVPLAPGPLITEAVEMQQALALSSSIELRADVPRDLPEILGDSERLLQVFENLIGNALKFTEPGGQVTVGAVPGDSGAVFWVADTGRGMTEEEIPRVFDPFWQASARSGRLGAGLGLPITRGIVEAHGGRIWVESAAGRGSKFRFSIPARPSGAPPSAGG